MKKEKKLKNYDEGIKNKKIIKLIISTVYYNMSLRLITKKN